jgi:preprotein translocase subunit SecE
LALLYFLDEMMKAVSFFKEVRQEVTKVKWPSVNEVAVTSLFVLVAAAISGVVLLLIDSAIYKLVKIFLDIGGDL